MSQPTDISHSAEDHSHGDEHHVMPISYLVGVFVILIVLTVLTVTASNLHLGPLEIWVAMGIATIKATLVALIFMHLLYDKPLNSMLFLFSLIFAAIFIGFAMVDSEAYQKDISAYELQLPK